MENYHLDISSAISTAWEYAKKYGLLVAVVYFVVGMVTGGIQNMFSGFSPDLYEQVGNAIDRGDWEAVSRYAAAANGGIASSLASFLGSLVSIVVSVALYNLALGLMSGRFSEVTFDAFKLPAQTYLKVVAVELIAGIAMALSLLFCLIPFFFVAPRLILAPVYQIEHPEAGVIESIQAGWNMTSGNTFSMLGLGFAMVGILIVGFCCCCIGVYFAEAIELFALIAAYNQLKGNLFQTTDYQQSTSNYQK